MLDHGNVTVAGLGSNGVLIFFQLFQLLGILGAGHQRGNVSGKRNK